jgi:Gram-negative bacterial TonB protein C-terminal
MLGAGTTPPTFGEGMTRPSLLPGSPALAYSAEWLEKGKAGAMIVRCTITRQGNTVDCQIFKPVEYMNEETLRWLSQQRWTPVTFRGEPVEVSYVFQFAFRHGVAPQRNGGW